MSALLLTEKDSHNVMILVDGKMCEECGRRPSAVSCDGCGKILCVECRIFEIWSYGCGHGDTKAFCRACYNDPDKNPWHAF